jgi:hypothetical protein
LDNAYNIAQIPFLEIDLKLSFHKELTEYYTGKFDENLEKIYNFFDREGCVDDLSNELRFFLDVHPFITEAINICGIEILKSSRFREKEIRKALENERKKKALKSQIVSMLQKEISIGGIYARDYLKSLIVSIYKSFEIEENATASYIMRYYSVKETSMQSEQRTRKTNGAFKILGIIE